MKSSRLLAAAALASCLSLPAVATAQYGSPAGSSGYGIFGGGTSGASSSFGRSSGFSQGGFSGSSQQGFGAGSSAGGLGRSAVGVGAGATVSPYLNLLRPGNAAVNYYALVRPQVQQNTLNNQYSTNFQQTDRMLLEQQQQVRQGLDPNLSNLDLQAGNRPAAPVDPRRRTADTAADPEVRDWANSKGQNDPVTSKDARQREASARQAKELKALEAELAANADSSKAATGQGTGAPPDRIPGTPYGFRPANHYFPSQGTPNRLGGNR